MSILSLLIVSPPMIFILNFLAVFKKPFCKALISFSLKFFGKASPKSAYFGTAFIAMASEILTSIAFVAICSKLSHALLKCTFSKNKSLLKHQSSIIAPSSPFFSFKKALIIKSSLFIMRDFIKFPFKF